MNFYQFLNRMVIDDFIIIIDKVDFCRGFFFVEKIEEGETKKKKAMGKC